MSRRGVLFSCVMVVALLIAGCGDGGSADTTGSPGGGVTTATQATPASYPPAPADVSGMSAWLSTAFPGARFLARISGIEYVAGEVPGSGGFANAIVITTDLDFATESSIAEEIALALGEAHPTWAAQYVIWFADGSNEHAGDIVDMTP